MKHLIGFLTCLSVCLSCSKGNNALDQLDVALSDYRQYVSKKSDTLNTLKEELRKAKSEEERYTLTMNLYRAYQDFSLDSAFVYIKQALQLANELGDQERIIDTRLSLAFLYNYAGFHHEALNIYQNENVEGHPNWLRRSHFYLGMNVYKNMSLYTIDETEREQYRQQMAECRDSAIAYAPDDVILRAERLSDNGKMHQAVRLLNSNLSDGLTTREAGLKYYILSEIYEKLKQQDLQVKYLAMSSTAGVHNAVREYIALRKLAVLLYEQGDIERAYTYIHRCIDDAEACNARMRMVETSTFLSVIDSAVVKQKQASRNRFFITAAVISLLLVLLATTLIVLRKKIFLLQKSEKEMIKVNSQLTNANNIKDEYITRFMRLCLDYISKMENYRKYLNKVARKRNFEELYETIQSTRYINKEVNDFYNSFDEAFLHIFPNFLKDFNALLRPEAQISPKKGERLNTELRIYALLKLGVSDSVKVQEFLRCSPSTVYNYRTNMRNKAINRDTFEQDVLAIK